MRKDEYGNECPSTLGEYQELVSAIFGTESSAFKMLASKIEEQGVGAEVVATDEQMRRLLFDLCFTELSDIHE